MLVKRAADKSAPSLYPQPSATVAICPFESKTRSLLLGHCGNGADSVNQMVPSEPTAILDRNRKATSPAAPSVFGPAAPLPAMVVIAPAASTRRMRLLPASKMYRLPASSSPTPEGELNRAAEAAAPSPLNPRSPV